jgi:NADPH-dependent glutamate synthase beta subunit-like oxidoreductase
MPKLTIDGCEVEVEPGSTILRAARKLGIDIPTLCFIDGCQPSASCMVCVVKVNGTCGSFAPACATIAEDGMQVESETDEVHEARRTALELLLSDHVGDCIAPCHRTCPAGMNIPLMIRQIAAGKLRDAIATVKRDIPLPAVLGRICPAPCEKVCRRAFHDSPVSICLLKRYVADVDLMADFPYLPPCRPMNGKKIAIVGAGPTGLSAAYYLLQEGYACVIFDDHEKPGGMLRYAVPEDKLPREVLDAEIAIIENLGAEFRMGTRVLGFVEYGDSDSAEPKTRGDHLSIQALQKDHDAVLIAVGELKEDDADGLRVLSSVKGIQIDRNILQAGLKGVFAAGISMGRKSRMAVRAVADGKAAASAIDQYISGLPITGSCRPFTVHMGKLADGEIRKFMIGVNEGNRVEPSGGRPYTDEEACFEATRCLHCDCRKVDNCKLRDYADAYGANPDRYKGERRLFEQHVQHPRPAPSSPHSVTAMRIQREQRVIYEPGKCIKCGLCIQITSKAKEELGFTFIGRGFDVRVGVPFNRPIEEGLRKVAAQCVAACPTGALAFR